MPTFSVSIPQELWDRLEDERGDVSRSRFVQKAVALALGQAVLTERRVLTPAEQEHAKTLPASSRAPDSQPTSEEELQGLRNAVEAGLPDPALSARQPDEEPTPGDPSGTPRPSKTKPKLPPGVKTGADVMRERQARLNKELGR